MACRKMNEDVAYARNTESGCKEVVKNIMCGSDSARDQGD